MEWYTLDANDGVMLLAELIGIPAASQAQSAWLENSAVCTRTLSMTVGSNSVHIEKSSQGVSAGRDCQCSRQWLGS